MLNQSLVNHQTPIRLLKGNMLSHAGMLAIVLHEAMLRSSKYVTTPID